MSAARFALMRHTHSTFLVVTLLLAAVEARAACNLIPSASKTFRGTLGDVNRPFAAPGDFVEVGASPTRCAAASPGFTALADDHIVSVVFEPPGNGARRVAFVTTLDCNGATAAAKRTACEATVGADRVTCVQAGPLAAPTDLTVVDRNGERRLAFRFPDTDALFGPDADDRTASGPATIAVTPAGSALPCGLATTPCAAQSGLIACIDTLFAADGSCQSTPDDVFSSFTALPPPNDFAADCFADAPPCTGLATETRLAVDAAGNLLLPVRWSGVLIRQNDVPVPRLIRATIKSPLPFPIPDATFLASYTPEGAKLPPIFEPQSDPSIADPDVITLFGSADAAYTILRFARRAGRCAGGPFDGNACSIDNDCPGGTCPTACIGGSTPDALCASDAGCAGGGRCGALFTDFRPVASYGGPLPLRRQAAGSCLLPPHASCAGPGDCPVAGDTCVGAGICQLAHGPCATNDDCSPGDACVSYAFEATTAIPLESLTSGSTNVLSFTVNESTRLSDDNGDGDSGDSVVTLRDRATGGAQAMGAPDGCSGVAADADGRAVIRISAPPFSFPAVETEGDLVAFLESESSEGYCDQSADDDRGDAIIRVFARGGGERTATLAPPHVADTALLVNDKALAVSDGLVFYRRPERGPAPNVTTRESLGPGGAEPNQGIQALEVVSLSLSSNGRFTGFVSESTNLVADDTNGFRDLFVRDHLTGVTERVNLTDADTQTCCGPALAAAISADGRYVAFGSLDGFLVPGDTNGQGDVFVRDRFAGSTERVSVATGGGEGSGGNPGLVACDAVAISADGRYVLFYSQFTNLVPDDTNDEFDLFVHDRLTDMTERVTLRDGGGEIPLGGVFTGALSADGRFVAFATTDGGMVPGDDNFVGDVFVRDRVTQRTERVSVTTDGAEGDDHSGFAATLAISDDGRFVAFGSEAGLVAADTNLVVDAYVHDRHTGITELVSVATGGVPLPTGLGSIAGGFPVGIAISGDGRFVAWSAPDGADAVPDDTNGVRDVFVYDRQTATTQRASVGAGGAQASGGDAGAPFLSRDGSTVAFLSGATDLVPGDTAGFADVFMRTLDLSPPGLDLFPDGAVDDTLLEVFDAATETAALLCPAGQVAVAAGRAAFLRPESAVGSGACPGGPLNDDGDTADRVVQLWESGGPVENLGLAATAVALSASHVAALADEAGEGAALNGGIDMVDQVVHVRALGAGAWTNVGEAADTLAVCGTVVPFITPEAAQNADRNGDIDQSDRILQLWKTAAAGTLVNTQLPAAEFVCGDTLIAFRSPEYASGAHRNGDADATDDVLTVYDTTTGLLHETGQAVTPCTLPECDPRLPYRVLGRSVKFLTLEPEQGNTDLNGDGDAVDLVIQTFDVDTGRTTTIGTVHDGADPLGGGDTGDSGTAAVYVSSGRCLESLDLFCADDGECPPTTTCVGFDCVRETGVCATQDDCDPASTCTPGGIVPASPDGDGDGVPDHLDNCPVTAPADQTDTDGDGVGDLCDVLTCGNDVKDAAETCDGADDAACPGACLADCTCCLPVADAKASVQVTTAKEAGALKVKLAIPLSAYDDEPVSVRLVDTDSRPVAAQSVGALAPKGSKGVAWAFKAKDLGVRQVSLKDDTAKHPGTFKLRVKAKEWFTAAQANRPAAESGVQVTIGSQCFSHTVTKKKD